MGSIAPEHEQTNTGLWMGSKRPFWSPFFIHQSLLTLAIISYALQRRKIEAGSMIGGMKETQEMMDFAAKLDVKLDVEVIPMDYVNTAMDCLPKSDVRYRFAIDIGNTLKSGN